MIDGASWLQALTDLYDTVVIILSRPIVQRQLAAFALVSLSAWLVSFLADRGLDRLTARTATRLDRQPAGHWWRRVLRVAHSVEYTFSPILGLIFGEISIWLFEQQGWRHGLIEQLIRLFWLLLIYRVLVALLFVFFTEKNAQRYQRRYLRPISIILVIVILYVVIAGTLTIEDAKIVTVLETPITLRSLFIAVVVFYTFLAVAWLLRDLLHKIFTDRSDVDPGVGNAISVVTYYSLIGAGLLVSLSLVGFNLSALVIIFGGLSVGIGFGLQELVANFMSGILLLFEQSLRPGDVIEINTERGMVSKLNMRATVLQTLDNTEIFVPNKTLLTSTVTTYTHTDRLVRRMVDVGVSYKSDPTEVRDILLRVAANHGVVLDEPEPDVFFEAYGESSLNFLLAVWIDDPTSTRRVLSDLRFMIWREFERNQIEIPFPQRDLHIRSADALAEILGESGDKSAPDSEPPDEPYKPTLP